MALKTVVYLTCDVLPCATKYPAEVILCIDSAKVAPHLCQDGSTEQTWEYRYIDAILVNVTKPCNSCTYKYEFSYDDSQILTGQTLYATDINGIYCKGCDTKYFEDLAGDEITFTSEDDGSITITTQHGCTFNFFPGESSLSVTDTNSVDLTLTAGPSKVLTADVKVSADVGNEIEIRADGIFADFTNTFVPPTDDSTDLGTTLLRFRNLYLSDSLRLPNEVFIQARNFAGTTWIDLLKLDASDNTYINAPASNEITFNIDALERWAISATGEFAQDSLNGSDIVFNKTQGIIRQGTSDGLDNAAVELYGGGAASITRGAYIVIKGNEYATNPGNLELRSGNIATADINLEASDDIVFVVNALNSWRIDGGDQGLHFEQAASIIRAETSNGVDTYELSICGGGDDDTGRGAYLRLSGNEHANNGNVLLTTGADAGAVLALNADSTTGQIDFQVNAAATRWSINSSGQFVQNATNGGPIVFAVTDGVIRSNTSNGTDNKSVSIGGGGDISGSRGAYVQMFGNEYAAIGGDIYISAGNAVGGSVFIGFTESTGLIELQNASAATIWSLNNSGDLNQNATNGGNLVFNRANKAVIDKITTGISAAGATQGTATALANIVNVVSTSAAGANGVVLPTAVAGAGYYVFNDDSADNVLVYPPVGGEINRLGTNVSITLTPGQGAHFKAWTTVDYFTTPV